MDLESIRGGGTGVLDRFAAQHGAVTYKSAMFNDIIPRGVATTKALGQMIDRVVAQKGSILKFSCLAMVSRLKSAWKR